jgi:hypothetical protein
MGVEVLALYFFAIWVIPKTIDQTAINFSACVGL